MYTTNHGIDVREFVEQHQFDGDEGVIVGSDVTDIVVELVWYVTQLYKHQIFGDKSPRLGRVRAVPDKLVQPERGRERGREGERERGRGREGEREKEM